MKIHHAFKIVSILLFNTEKHEEGTESHREIKTVFLIPVRYMIQPTKINTS